MERNTIDVCRDIFNYWKSLLSEVESPEVDIELKQSIYNCDLEILKVAVKSSKPNELYHALESDNEAKKLYYMQRIWYRYLDLFYKRTRTTEDYIELTNDSSIHELDITIESVKLLHQENVHRLFQIPDKMQNLPYSAALDISAALSLLERRKAIC